MGFCSHTISTQDTVACNGNGGIVGITLWPWGSGSTGSPVSIIPETASYTGSVSGNSENGTAVLEEKLTFKVGQMSGVNRAYLASLASNYMRAMVICANGDTFYLGDQNTTSCRYPAYLTSGNMASGTKFDDANEITAELTTRSPYGQSVGLTVKVTFATGTVKYNNASGTSITSGSMVPVGSVLYISHTTGTSATITWSGGTTSTVALDSTSHSTTFVLTAEVTSITYTT